MLKNNRLLLGDIVVYFCSLPDLQSVTETSVFSPLKNSIINYFDLKDYVLNQIDTAEKKDESKKNNDSDKPVIIIAFTKMQTLYDPHTYIKLTEDETEKYSAIHGNKPIDPNSKIPRQLKTRSITHCYAPLEDFQKYRPYPIILIGLEDISKISGNKKYDNASQYLKYLNLDPRVKFFDASIWHRYVALDDNFFTNFQAVMVEFIEHYQNELYDTVVSCEYMEFQTRMLRNSFLALIGSEGHGRNVTPFKYHSETLMKKKANDELEKIVKKASQIRWEFLLVDDYGDVPLRAKHDRNIKKTKKQIIDSLINIDDQHKIVEITNAVEMKKTHAELYEEGARRGLKDVIQFAEEKIKNKMYDIILLDYLLGENSKEKRREYGHELLEKINSSQLKEPILRNKGPMNSFWIFPISVFSYAILDELYEKGIGHFGEHWHLASGADPVNTPQLFRYKLYRFINMQLQAAGVNEEFKAIVENPPAKNTNMQNWASNILGKLLLEFGNKKKLIEDAKSGQSEFAKSVINSDAEIHYYEHLQHLIYLLAHGSGLEWPEMWHELEYLKTNLTLSKKLPANFFNCIEKYISELQGEYS